MTLCIRVSTTLVLSLSLAALASAGCSSAPVPGEPPAAQTSEAVAADNAARSPCPSSLPRDGAACTDDNLLCSWGDDTRFGCRQEARCSGGAWKNLTYSCPPREPSCPARAPGETDGGALGGNTCSAADLGMTCVYGEVAYTCTPCDGTLCVANKNVWFTGNLSAGCPARVPNFGQACASNGLYCNYNVCADDQLVDWVFGASLECENGFWTAYADSICL
jgi:hypothetical protein